MVSNERSTSFNKQHETRDGAVLRGAVCKSEPSYVTPFAALPQ